MDKENKSGEFGRVLYFDPNDVNIRGDVGNNLSAIFKGVEVMNNPEDYSIAVDLEVTTKTRSNVTSNDNKMVYSMSKTEGINNFLQGSDLGDQNVLSTFFTDTTYNGNNPSTQNEALCINSIDIEFSSWYVASVIIKFTDVRGSALFSPTEYLETEGANKKVSDGNLFSGFFTMPYPIFNLRIKGFYGEAVTYPLHLQDFKAEFNAEKGNFDITAQFIGYTYAMLSDIQMTYLMAAPYSTEYGMSYWEEQVNNGRFTTLEGNPLQKIPELLKKIKKGEYVTSKIKGSNESAVKAEEINKRTASIAIITDSINAYIGALKTNYKVEGTTQTKLKISTLKNSTNKILTPSMENDALVGPKIVELFTVINQYINTYSGDTMFSQYKGEEAKKYFQIKKITTKDLLMCGELDVSEIFNKIDINEKNNNNELEGLGKEVASTVTNTLIESYQMVPSIYNFYKLLLAHMETLLHIVGACANNVIKNEKRQFAEGMEGTDFINNKLLPFPWFTVDNKDEWIGNKHPDFSEVKLVKSLIKAKNEISVELEKLETEVPTVDIAKEDTTASVGPIWFPINAFDNSINIIGKKSVKPYSNLIKENGANENELKAILSTRIATIVGLSADVEYNKSVIDAYVISEFKNIIDQLGTTKEHVDKVINALINIKTSKSNKDIKKGSEYVLLRDYNYNNIGKRSYEYNILNTNGVLPLTDDSIETLRKSIKNGSITSNIMYYKDTSIQGKTDYLKKYKPTNTVIIDGRLNCEAIYDNWYKPIKLLTETETNIQPILNRIKLEKTNSALAFDDDLSYNSYGIVEYPLMNRIAYTKPELIKGSNDNTILSLQVASGYKEQFKAKSDIDIDSSNQTINPFIFYDRNLNFKNLYKLYLGKNSVADVQDLKIDKLKRSEFFLNDTPDSNKLTYPLIGGNFEIVAKSKRNKGFWSGLATFINDEGNSILRSFGVKTNNVNHMWATCLFGNTVYYAQNDFMVGIPSTGNTATEATKKARRAKSFLFLQTLPVKIISLTDDIIKNDNNFNRSFMIRMSKAEALLLGSMLWRRKVDVNNSPNNYLNSRDIIRSGGLMTIPDTGRYFRIDGMFTISNEHNKNFDKCEILSKIDAGSLMEDELIKLFEEWSDDSSSSDGWYKIQNTLELRRSYQDKMMTQSEFNKFAKNFVSNSNVQYLRSNLNSKAIENYSNIEPINEYMIGLINRDKSAGVQAVLNLLFNECILNYTGDAILSTTKTESGLSINNSTLTESNVNIIIDRLVSKLEEHKETLSSVTSKLPDQTTVSSNSFAAQDTESIELAVYKYLKILYDKWVSGYEYNTKESAYKWISSEQKMFNGFNTYNIKNFKFIDRSYHNIGDKFIINYAKVLENFAGISEQRNLYSTITDILSSNNFLFLPMPNYQSWENVDDFAKIFKQIPYVESNINNNDDGNALTSIFVCMYTGDPSKKLNIGTQEYEYADDSINLNSYTALEPDFNSKNEVDENIADDIMTKVPAFAVSYGKQNQSYFKNITLNQNNPATTEASLGVLKNLTDKADKNSAVTTLSQDMYTLYSQYSYTCQVEMLGCPQIQPMMYFQLTNVPMWNGAYLIYKVNHSIRPGHMTTNFTGMRMGKAYPKLVTPTIVSGGDMNTINQGVSPKNDKISNLSLDTKLGKYFTLGEYTKNEGTIPEYIVSRLQNNVAPTIDSIYDTWAISELNKNYGKFQITSGYRNKERNEAVGGASTSQHVQGLAVDLQLLKPTKEGNDALFEHIKQRMRNGLKMDQLIKEPSGKGGGWCHVSPVYTDGTSVDIRGQALVFNSSYHTIKNLSETIPQAQGTSKLATPLSINNSFIEYWKKAENGIKNGWNNSKKLWFAHKSTEGGAPTIAYGIKLLTENLASNEMKLMPINKLQDGTLGITDQTSINEIISKANKALGDIKKIIDKKYGVGSFDKIQEKYKYALVDIHMNTGNIIGWPAFTNAAVKNDLAGMLKNCDRSYVSSDGVKHLLEQRNNLFKQYLQS